MEEAEPMMDVGVYLGTRIGTCEYRIGAPYGVVKAVTIKRLPKTHPWQKDLIPNLVGYPWAPFGQKSVDGRSAAADVDHKDPDQLEVPDRDE